MLLVLLLLLLLWRPRRQELPECDVEHLEEILATLKAATMGARAFVVRSLLEKVDFASGFRFHGLLLTSTHSGWRVRGQAAQPVRPLRVGRRQGRSALHLQHILRVMCVLRLWDPPCADLGACFDSLYRLFCCLAQQWNCATDPSSSCCSTTTIFCRWSEYLATTRICSRKSTFGPTLKRAWRTKRCTIQVQLTVAHCRSANNGYHRLSLSLTRQSSIVYTRISASTSSRTTFWCDHCRIPQSSCSTTWSMRTTTTS